MKLLIINHNKVLVTLISLLVIILLIVLLQHINFHKTSTTMVMGGKLSIQALDVNDDNPIDKNNDVEKYFRPSNMPILNDRFTFRFFDSYVKKEETEIKIPDKLVNSPQNTILNYYSILREAANPEEGKEAGCGTIGYATIPYPVAYHFLSSSYRASLSYKDYLNTFNNILHINLLKYREVPVYDKPYDTLRYFIELETIEGSNKHSAYFAYYYGYLDMISENGQYKISNLELFSENYLCAPYHGCSYDAEMSVQIRYGDWCSLIKEMYPTTQKGYVKNISFKGTDGHDYLIVFYQLTNDTDIEIAQYVKADDDSWKLKKLNPEKCIKDTKEPANH